MSCAGAADHTQRTACTFSNLLNVHAVRCGWSAAPAPLIYIHLVTADMLTSVGQFPRYLDPNSTGAAVQVPMALRPLDVALPVPLQVAKTIGSLLLQ